MGVRSLVENSNFFFFEPFPKQSDAGEIKKNVVKQKSFAEMVEEADLVTEGPISPVTETTKKVDQGNFTDVVVQSPIIHKTRQVNQKI